MKKSSHASCAFQSIILILIFNICNIVRNFQLKSTLQRLTTSLYD